MNDGNITRIPDRNDQKGSAIDLSFATPDLVSTVHWLVADNTLGSDHLPITIRINHVPVKTQTIHTQKYNYNKANWHLFRAKLEDTPTVDLNSVTVDEGYEALCQQITQAANAAIPVTKAGTTRTKNNPWWNSKCDEARDWKMYYTKRWKKTRNKENHLLMTESVAISNKTNAEAKKQHWSNYVDTLNDQSNLGNVYDKMKKMKSQFKLPDYDLNEDGKTYSTVEEKAGAFAETFRKASSMEGLPMHMQQARQKFEQENPLSHPYPDNTLPINTKLTMAELERALSSVTKVKVSEGPDLVSYRMLRELPWSQKEQLLTFFQKCWETGVIPKAWKHAIVTPIPKQGKSRKEVSNYRPISLTSHTGKIYERIVKARLTYFCEKNKVIPLCQAGFRAGRGVSDHLVSLGSHVRRALTRKKVLYTCLFDIRRAYDTVWHRKLLQKIKNIGISGHMFNFVQSFLTNRTLQVRWRGALSTSHNLEMGVPQGSVIAPLLFSIMLHDVNSVKTLGSTITLYADDLAVWREGSHKSYVPIKKHKTPKKEFRLFQELVDGVSRYMSDNGFSLSPQKTVFVIFTRGIIGREVSIKVAGELVHNSTKARYLGAQLDRKATGNDHVKENLAKAKKAINLIKALAVMPWANHPKTMVTLVKTLVRSRLFFGIETFHDLHPCRLNEIEILECKALKIALGLPKCTPRHLTYREAGMLPAEKYIKLKCACYTYRAQTVNNSTKEELAKSFKGPRTVSRCTTIGDFISDLTQAAGVEEAEVAGRPLHPYPPWTMNRATVNLSMADINKQQDPLYIQTVANEYIQDNFHQKLQIYTDGSLTDEGVGAAFCIPKFNNCTRKFALPGVTIYTAELVAILMALSHLNDMRHSQTEIVILSDSMSALSSIKTDGKNSREDLVKEIQTIIHQIIEKGTNVTLQWVPAHCNIRGNELADRAAKAAAGGRDAEKIKIPLGYADIKARLCRAVWKQWTEEFAAIPVRNLYDKSVPTWDGVMFPSLPTHVARIAHRLHLGIWKTMFIPKKCICDQFVSFYHVIFKCPKQAEHFKPLVDILNHSQLQLSLESLASRHCRLGWDVLTKAAKLVYKCESASFL